MKPPSDSARRLLGRYKEASSLGSERKTRLGEIVQQRVLRGDLPRFDVVPGAQAAAHHGWLQKLWASSATKWGVGALVAAAVGAGGYRAWHEDAADSLREAPAAAVTRPLPPSEPVPAQASSNLPAEPAAPNEPAAPEARQPRPEKPSLPAPSRSPAPSAEPTVDEEVKLINSAQAALRAGDAKHALELLSQHAARFPAGKLATLQQVTHMMALCQAGKAEQARQEAADFVATKPSSPFVERVKTICAAR
ncbi:MAG TPA: hypothetical protein VHB79_37045 [Polyangiaceae bacterium]|nr:hypothetical protein [Polyangiaceae bacterium]